MRIVKYIDVFPFSTGKGDIWFVDENTLSQKGDNCKRYKVIVDVPDFHEVDGQLGPNRGVEILESTKPAQVKIVEVIEPVEVTNPTPF